MRSEALSKGKQGGLQLLSRGCYAPPVWAPVIDFPHVSAGKATFQESLYGSQSAFWEALPDGPHKGWSPHRSLQAAAIVLQTSLRPEKKLFLASLSTVDAFGRCRCHVTDSF